MSKAIVVRGLINEEGPHFGKFLGYVTFETTEVASWITNRFPANFPGYKKYFFNFIVDGKLVNYAGGAQHFVHEVGIFSEEHDELVKSSSTEPLIKKIKFEVIEIDYTDILNIKSKLLYSMSVEGREAYKTEQQANAFFKVLEVIDNDPEKGHIQ